MDNFGLRFEQKGAGVYLGLGGNESQSDLQIGGKSENEKDLSPTSCNWKKKYLEIKIENDNLKKENEKLKKKIKRLESK